MKDAEPTADEIDRLEALESLKLAYSPAEARFDMITRLARDVFDVPIALVSLVTRDRQWFKSAQGLAAAETPRDVSFCGHAIQGDEALIVEDATAHEWFADNPLVTGEPNVRFYAGQPLNYQGRRIGTLCLIDRVPRHLQAKQLEKLKVLAKGVEEELTRSVLSNAQRDVLDALDEVERGRLIDPTTRLWNREGIERVLIAEFGHAARENRSPVLLLVSLGGLDELAGKSGSAVVEDAVAEYAQRLRAAADPADALARYARETLVVIYDHADEAASRAKAERIVAALADGPVQVGPDVIELPVRGSSMIAYSPARLAAADLLLHAGKALEDIKDAPSGTINFFDRRAERR